MRILRTLTFFAIAASAASFVAYPLDPGETQNVVNFMRGAVGGASQTEARGPERSAQATLILGSTSPVFRFASVERGSVEQTVTVTGSLQPVKTVEVGSQLSGQLSRVYVDFNDTVHKGEPLAQIDPRTFKAKVDEAQSMLDEALADVKIVQAKLDRARANLGSAKAQEGVLKDKLESAKALEDSAKRNARRKLILQSHNIAAAATVEDAQTDLVSKTAAKREAQKMVDLNAYAVEGADADLRTLEAELDKAKATVPEKEAVLHAAQADLDRTIIRSPIDGVIVGRFVDQGQTLAVGLESRTAFNVAHRLQDMEIYARVDETDIGKIAPGQSAHFTVDAYPDRRFEAVVRQVRKAPSVTQNVVTYTVVLTTGNPDGALLPGMTALVKIIIDHQDNVLKVPMAALRFQPDGVPPVKGVSTVWVRAGMRVRRVPIVVASVGADQVALKNGELSAGDQVVVGQTIRPAGRELFGIRLGS